MLTEDNNENSFIIRNTCAERCNKSVEYYCESCNIAGCSHCMLRVHQKHNYQPLINKVCIITDANHLLLLQLSELMYFYFVVCQNAEQMTNFCITYDRVSKNLQRIQQTKKVSPN